MTRASLQAEILARFSESPERPCLSFRGPRESGEWLSREEVCRKALAAAEAFREEGLEAGRVCVVVLPSGDACAHSVLGILFLGAIPLLVAPPTLVSGNSELVKTLAGVLRRTAAPVLVCSSPGDPDLAELRLQFPKTRFVSAPSGIPPQSHSQPLAPALPRSNDVAAMQLTSGTTGMPRICVWDHNAVLAALDGMQAAMALSADDLCVNWTPLYHDMGFVNNFFLCLARGVPLVFLSPQDFVRRPALWLQTLSETGATTTWSPNFGFAITARKAQDRELEGVRLDRVRAFWNAAERIHLETLNAFYNRFAPLGVRREALKTNFGCAENIGGATFSDLDAAAPHEVVDRRLLDERGLAKPCTEADTGAAVSVVSAGRGHPHLEVRILSPRGRVLPDGRVGEICLATPSRMLGYCRDARATRRALRDGLLHTGDLGYLRGGNLFWVGRIRERIVIRGKKIDPSAFESILGSIPGLRPGCFAAFGAPDKLLGTERLVIVSEVAPDARDNVRQLAAAISQNCFLQMGLAPADVLLVQPGSLAKTSSGKRRHSYFRKLYLAGGLQPARLAACEPDPSSVPATSGAPASGPPSFAGFDALLYRLRTGERNLSLVQPEEMEDPFRSLLVHSADMTPTLEDAVGCAVQLSVLHCEVRSGILFRQVLLLADRLSHHPLAFGNIEIPLDNLPAPARARVLDGVTPFGTILREEAIPHSNGGALFFRVRLKARLSKYFQVEPGRFTYGRYRQVAGHTGLPLAEVMEILSPLRFV